MFKELLNIILAWLSPPPKAPPATPKTPTLEVAENKEVSVEIDWTNPAANISKHFTVKEALYLPSWNVIHIPNEIEKENILKMAKVMDKVRDFIGKPIIVHVWIRPILNSPGHKEHGQDYNKFIKGAKMSAHKDGRAVDWHCKDYNCDYVRRLLQQKLEEYDMRVEDLPGSNWIHSDIKTPVNNNRYFKP